LNNSKKVQKRISTKGVDQLKLFGFQDNNLKILEKVFKGKIVARGSELVLEGEPSVVEALQRIFYELIMMVTKDQDITEKDVETVIDLVKNRKSKKPPVSDDNTDSVILYTKDGFIKPKSKGQKAFCESSKKNDIVFAIGPAGTGKTFLAVAMAVAALRDREVDRIVLTRPAVEAGESLGFLPGDFREKVDPYLRPLYDALYNMIPADKLKRYLETRIIEIVPLAYMRGRTLNSAFVILDEAQNTSFNQMKMFLTRLGISSKAIITGDITQIDLPDSKLSGLVQVRSILSEIEGIEFIYLTEGDVVRHRLVRDIIKAYDTFENLNNNNQK
jgi:phosphate starvation-inducible PhoH-like protein